MGLSWSQYNLLYYFLQYGFFIIIYFFLVIFIPYDLLDWIAETVLFLKPVHKEEESTDSKIHRNTEKSQNYCSCCCLWMPLKDLDTNNSTNNSTNNPTNWRSWRCSSQKSFNVRVDAAHAAHAAHVVFATESRWTAKTS
jgi:hypothetical protein